MRVCGRVVPSAMRFAKLHGTGNDFLVVDQIGDGAKAERRDWGAIARGMCDRHTGVGADGLVVIGRSDAAAFRMLLFNADGSGAEMSGNGIRCAVKRAVDGGLAAVDGRGMVRVETGRGVLEVIVRRGSDGLVAGATADMGAPAVEAGRIPVALAGLAESAEAVELETSRIMPWGASGLEGWLDDLRERHRVEGVVTCVSMGNPHAVIFCGSVSDEAARGLGRHIGRQAVFPNGVNVHFAQVIERDRVQMRAFERGVGLTRSCATGACAVVVAGVMTGRLEREVRVSQPGGELSVRWDAGSGHVFLEGPAAFVFEGEWGEAGQMGFGAPGA